MKQDTLRDILHIVFKYKTMMILMFILIMIGGTVGTLLMKPVYEASAKVLVKIGRENIYMPKGSQASQNPIIYDTSKDERINSEVEIIKSRNLIEQVLRDMGVEHIFPTIGKKRLFSLNPFLRSLTPFEKAVYIISEKDLNVQRIPKSDIIEIKFAHENPVIAAEVVNKFIKVYLQHHLSVYNQLSEFGFFDEQVKFLKAKLNASEAALEAFCKQNNIISLDEQKTFLLQQISFLENDSSKTRSEISENAGKLTALKGSGGIKQASEALGEETDLNPNVISTLRNKLMELKLEEEDLLNKYPPSSGLVINLRKEMKKAQDLLDKEERIYHDKAMNSIQHTLSALKGKEASQSGQMGQYHYEMDRLNALDQKYKELKRQVEIDEANYQLHVKHMEEARISNAMDSQKIANISIIEEALPPIEPIKPILWLNLLLSGILGIIVSAGSVFLISYFSHYFQNAEDIQNHLNLPVLASIPELKRNALHKGAK
jgi:polysaccharide biosynthesis protein PslE